MAILELFNQSVGSFKPLILGEAQPTFADTSGFHRGDVCHVWPDDNVDGWTDFAAYVVQYPKRFLIMCPGMPFDRAERCWKEKWERAPVPGEEQYDTPDDQMDDDDRIIYLGRKRWSFNVDPDNDPEPLNADRVERRIVLEGDHIMTAYSGTGGRPVKFNPWMHDRCKERADTLQDVDDYDVATNRRKSPRRRFDTDLRRRRRG